MSTFRGACGPIRMVLVPAIAGLALVGCGTGTPHLQRPLLIPAGTPMPVSVRAAEHAIAQAKAAGAADIPDARYTLARAQAFLLNAQEEFMDGDPTDVVDRFAAVALVAATEARAIAERRRR